MVGIRNVHSRMHTQNSTIQSQCFTNDRLYGDCSVAHVSPLEFKRSRKSQKPPLLTQVDDSQLFYYIVLMPWKLPDTTGHGNIALFSAFVVEAAWVYPLNPNFPKVPRSSPSGQELDQQDCQASMIPLSCWQPGREKSGTLMCTDAQTHTRSSALPLAAVTYADSADEYNSLCTLWSTTRGALGDVVFPLWFWTRVSSSAQLSWMEIISDGLLLCLLSCLACFEGRVAQQTVN